MKTIIKKIFFVLTIMNGCIALTSCQNDTISQDVMSPEKASMPARTLWNNSSNLENYCIGDGIPDVEDEFGTFVGQIHNDAVDYIMSQLENLNYSIFTATEAQTNSILTALCENYLDSLAGYYGFDADALSNIPVLTEFQWQTYVSDSISSDMQYLLQDIVNVCINGSITELADLYSAAEMLNNDKERMLVKTYITSIQYSYQYWSTSNYSALSFLPVNIMDEYECPSEPILFTNEPVGISWGRVGNADGEAILRGLVTTISVYYLFMGPQFVVNWSIAGTIIAINAAVASVRACLEISLYNNIDAMNSKHPYFYDHNNGIYEYMNEMYDMYGSEYFEDNWDGKFYFMVDSF